MEDQNLAFTEKYRLHIAGVAVVALIALAFGGYLYYRQTVTLTATSQKLASSTELVLQLEKEKTDLQTNLEKERAINEGFSAQISGIASTVGILDKLSKTDKELLQKYSKVYFLNENYIPDKLVSIDQKFLVDKTLPLDKFHAQAYTFLKSMLNEANDEGVPLLVSSAYRSFGTQGNLKANYRVIYGETSASTFSADQGYSEHQLGTAVDLTVPDIANSDASFADSRAYKWLRNNAYKYGFVLSYPRNNGFYVFEPWHWRFVGRDLAKLLYDQGDYFYDLEQREIDSYLVKIFD